MKKILMLAVLLFPVSTFAFNLNDEVSIAPLALPCGEQNASFTVNANYGIGDRFLVTYSDIVKLDDYGNKPATVNQSVHLTVGDHELKAIVYLMKVGGQIFFLPVAQTTRNVTVVACPPVEPPATTTPPVEPPATTTPPVVEQPPVVTVSSGAQGVSGSGGGSSPATRLCYLSGGQICLPYSDNVEMIKAQMLLIEFYLTQIIQANQK